MDKTGVLKALQNPGWLMVLEDVSQGMAPGCREQVKGNGKVGK